MIIIKRGEEKRGGGKKRCGLYDENRIIYIEFIYLVV